MGSGVDVFLNTALLSQNMSEDPSNGTPNMRNFYRNVLTNSTASLSAVNLDPKFDVSTEICFLLNHRTGSRLHNINMFVWDRIVTLSNKLSESSKQYVDISLPLGCGISYGIASFSSR